MQEEGERAFATSQAATHPPPAATRPSASRAVAAESAIHVLVQHPRSSPSDVMHVAAADALWALAVDSHENRKPTQLTAPSPADAALCSSSGEEVHGIASAICTMSVHAHTRCTGELKAPVDPPLLLHRPRPCPMQVVNYVLSGVECCA